MNYEHPRQGSDRAEDPHGTIPKLGASGTRRQLGGSPTGNSHAIGLTQSLLSRTFNCGTLAPRRQEPEADPQLPDYIESSTPSGAMLYHRYTRAGSMTLPWRQFACPWPNLLRRLRLTTHS